MPGSVHVDCLPSDLLTILAHLDGHVTRERASVHQDGDRLGDLVECVVSLGPNNLDGIAAAVGSDGSTVGDERDDDDQQCSYPESSPCEALLVRGFSGSHG